MESEEPGVQNANRVKRSTAIFLAIYVTGIGIKTDGGRGNTSGLESRDIGGSNQSSKSIKKKGLMRIFFRQIRRNREKVRDGENKCFARGVNGNVRITRKGVLHLRVFSEVIIVFFPASALNTSHSHETLLKATDS